MIDSFFGIHPFIVRTGIWREMKPGERDLYLYLMEESERYCTRELILTDAQVRAAVGTASRTLCNARKKLQERGLIRYTAGVGNKYRYVICDPKTGLPYPGDPHEPIRIPKGKIRRVTESQTGNGRGAEQSDAPTDQQKMPIQPRGLARLFLN